MPGTVTAPDRERRNKVASLAISAWSPDDSVRNSVKTRKCDLVLGCVVYTKGQRLWHQERERPKTDQKVGFPADGSPDDAVAATFEDALERIVRAGARAPTQDRTEFFDFFVLVDRERA